jgi:cell division protein ZapE
LSLPDAYRDAFRERGYTPDSAQRAAIAELDALRAALARAARRERGLGWRLRAALGRVPARAAVRGVYLWGRVGRGKTLLLDIFTATLDVPVERVHFHRFIHGVHERLGVLREAGVADPLAHVAAEAAARVRVLCFDELFVGDITDAMLLGGVFEALTRRGVTLVFTSNTPPAGLYPDGLQRSRFLPTIALLERVTAIVELDGGTDYRLRQLARAPLYFASGAPDADARLAERFTSIAGTAGSEGGELKVGGRPIAVRRRAPGAAWFEFSALCEGPRATNDYIELANQYHTVVLANVPAFTTASDDAARRFIALVDEFYARGVKLVVSAAAEPAALYGGERLAADFRRTASRLVEMQSYDYLARPHLG